MASLCDDEVHSQPTSVTKTCTKCGETKPVSEFYRDRNTKSGYRSWCKMCRNEQHDGWVSRNRERANEIARESAHRRGRCQPLGTNTRCPSYLGVYIAEWVLRHVFDHVEQMPYENPGFDFRCGRGYNIDVKSACRIYDGYGSDRWVFHIRKNTIADYFLCLAFDDRDNLEPEHIWLLPGELVNDKLSVGISESRLEKWSEYELNDKLDKIVACCDTLRGENYETG